jgi:hypothetical protein
MVGWVEVVLGIGFADLADRFDRGGILARAGPIIETESVSITKAVAHGVAGRGAA